MISKQAVDKKYRFALAQIGMLAPCTAKRGLGGGKTAVQGEPSTPFPTVAQPAIFGPDGHGPATPPRPMA